MGNESAQCSLNCTQTAVSCTHPVLCLYIISSGQVWFVHRVSKGKLHVPCILYVQDEYGLYIYRKSNGKLQVFCYDLILSDTFLSISRVQNHYKICSIIYYSTFE